MSRLCASIVILVFFVACKSKQINTQLVGRQTPQLCPAALIPIDSLSSIPDSVKAKMYKIRGDAAVKFKDQSFKVDFQLRIKLDSIVWISLSKSSFPIAKMKFTQDSIKVVDLFNKKYLKTSYDSITSYTGLSLNFELIQRSLLGQSFSFDSLISWVDKDQQLLHSNVTKDDLHHYQNRDTVARTGETATSSVKAQYVNCNNKEIFKQFYLSPKNAFEVWVEFGGRDSSTALVCPSQTKIQAFQTEQGILNCQLNYKRFKAAQAFKTILKIPADYEPLD